MYELTVSHTSLTLRVTRDNTSGYLEIACLEPFSIKGPVNWSNADLKIELSDPEGFIVIDDSCGLEIKTGSVEIVEINK